MKNNAEIIIKLENVVKSFDNEQILKSINLDIRDKEFIKNSSNKIKRNLIGKE